MHTRALAAALAVAAIIGAAVAPSQAAPSAGVRWSVPHRGLYPGENVTVAVHNATASVLYRSDTLLLERYTGAQWHEVIRSHGVRVALPIGFADVQRPHSTQVTTLILYDDLRPGIYRVSLYYRVVPRHWKVLAPLTRRDQVLRQVITLHRAPALREPTLSESRLLAIAQGAAAEGGDANPSLIQHAAGRRFEANLIAGGDEVFEWNWSYLIAIRGHFSFSDAPRPAGAPPPSGSVITLVLDAASGEVADTGVSNTYPDLARLGPVRTDRG